MASPTRRTRATLASRVALCAAALLLAAGASACSSAGKRGSTAARHPETAVVEPSIGTAVVRVGRHSLTAAMVEHWTRVEGALNYRYTAEFKRHPTPPRGAIPDPPSFAGCIAYLAARAKVLGTQAHDTTRAALHGECVHEYQAQRLHILEILLTYFWVLEERRSQDVVISNAEVQHLLDQEFSSRRALERYLVTTGEREADERFILAGQLGIKKLQERISPLRRTGHESAQMAGEVDYAYQRWGDALKRRWIPRTDCRAGYVVVECRDYRGTADNGGARTG